MKTVFEQCKNGYQELANQLEQTLSNKLLGDWEKITTYGEDTRKLASENVKKVLMFYRQQKVG